MLLGADTPRGAEWLRTFGRPVLGWCRAEAWVGVGVAHDVLLVVLQLWACFCSGVPVQAAIEPLSPRLSVFWAGRYLAGNT